MFGDQEWFDQFDSCARLTSSLISCILWCSIITAIVIKIIIIWCSQSISYTSDRDNLSHDQTRHMPPRNSSASSKFIGGSPLQKELQGVAAFIALADIHRKGDSITHAMQHTMIGEKYFGNPSDPDSNRFGRAISQWERSLLRAVYSIGG
jgi:hypothetical protein